MLLRIRREIFRAGDFETHELEDVRFFREDVCKKYHLDTENTLFYDDTGRLVKEDVFEGYAILTAVQKPAEAVSWSTVLISIGIAALFTAGAIWYIDWRAKNSNNAKITYSNSLRGAQNPLRVGGPIGVLLGNYRVPLDMAGMVYSSISNNKQYIHQLFCAGYRPISDNQSPYYNENCGVQLRKDTSQVSGVYIYGGDGNPQCYKAWIGDTPFGSFAKSISISASEEHADIQQFPYYNKRCVEDGLSIKMLNADTTKGGSADNILQYTAATGATKIGVCVSAPYGYYKLDKNANQTATLMSYKVQYRVVGASNWSNIVAVHNNVNVNEYRVLHVKDLTTDAGYSVNNQYEVRLFIDDGDAYHTDSKYNTSLLAEFIQYDTVNTAKYIVGAADATSPVYNSQQYELVDLKAQATDKLTGYIDQFYVECYLQCRAYHGNGSETSNYQSQWYVPSTNLAVATRIEMMSNPASVLLYVLTNKNVNPRALTWEEAANKIDWVAFRDWYLFCAEKQWTCNAWITEEMTVGKLCNLICRTGRAVFRMINGKYSVLLACEIPYITQMFTPRNAWDMQMTKNFEKPLDAVRVEFVDENLWDEAERTAYIDAATNTVIVDEDITEEENSLTVESFSIWGVTRPKQIADLEAYELLQRHLQIRTYTWKCAVEGLLCAVGDVVYIANDNFLYSLGYGRIKSLEIANGYITGVYVDESLSISNQHTYGITVRQNDGTFSTYPISSIETDTQTFDRGILCKLANPIPAISAPVKDGNLFMYGDTAIEGKKLLITNIQYDKDRNASIEAVDYIPEIFQSLDGPSWVVPAYVSGISKYGSGTNIAKGVVPSIEGQRGPAGPAGQRGSIWSEGTAITGGPPSSVIRYGFAGIENDMYLNTDTGDVYTCITAGDASTAEWVYTMNNVGDDAAYFRILPSQTAFERNPRNPVATTVELTADVRNIDDYTVSWSTPIVGATIVPSTGSPVTLTIPYSVTNTVEVDATLSQGGASTEAEPVLLRSRNSIKANAAPLRDSNSIEAVAYISPISVPISSIYFGLYNDATHPFPTIGDDVVRAKGVNSFVNGDYFLCGVTTSDSSVEPPRTTVRGFIYEYLNGEWVHTNATETSERVTSAAKDYATLLDSMGEEADTSVFAIIGVFKTLVASSAVITELFSKAITVGNVIKSANYAEDSQPTPITINGQTYNVLVPRTGFCFGSNGVAKFVDGIANNLTAINAKLQGAQIQEAVIEESTFSGDITSYLLDTVNAPTPGTAIHLEAEGSQSSHDYWASANVKNMILSRAQAAGLSGLFAANTTSANFGTLVGTYAGNPVGFLKIGNSDVVVESANVASASTSFLQYSVSVPVTGTYKVLATPRKFAGERYDNLDVDPSETELIPVEDYEEVYVWHNRRKYVSGSTISATAGSIITFEFGGAASFTDEPPYGKQWYIVYTDELAAIGNYSCSLTPSGFANPQMFNMNGGKIDWPLYSQSTISLSANSSSLVNLSRATNTDWDVAIGSNLGTNFAFIDFTLPSGVSPIDTVHITSVSYDILMPTNDGRGYTHVTSANKTVTRVTLSATSATFVLANGAVDEVKGPIRGYTINFTPEAKSVGIFTRTLEPKAKETPSEKRTIGTQTNPYDDIWAGTFHGTVDGAISGEATYTPKGTVSSPAITVTPATTKIRLAADLLNGGILRLSLVQDTDTPSAGGSISSPVDALSGVSAALAAAPIFTGTEEVIHIGN